MGTGARVAPDPAHSLSEQRFIAIGRTPAGRPVFIAFCFRGARVLLSQDGQCWAVDRDGTCGVPLAGEEAHVLLDLDDVALYGTFDGRALTPLAASSALGPFWSSRS